MNNNYRENNILSSAFRFKAWAGLLDKENESKVALRGLNATQLTGAESVPGLARYQISSSTDYISGRHTAIHCTIYPIIAMPFNSHAD